MTTFKGLTDWFEIFRTGTWTDAAGNTREWTEQDLDTIAANYKPDEEEAPLVIGHPEIDAPAWGWVESVKRVGGVLYAKAKQVVTEFEDMVEQGLFKKRSIKLSPDGNRLMHVGFLGAAAPAVKGLENIAFRDKKQGITMEFGVESWTLETIARIFRSIRDWLIEKEGKEKADSIIPDWDVEYIKDEARADEPATGFTRHNSGGFAKKNATKEVHIMSDFKTKLKNMLASMGIDMSKVPDDAIPDEGIVKTFTEGEVQAQVKAAAEKAATEAKAAKDKEFAEREKTARVEARKAEILVFCEGLKDPKDLKILPSWEKYGLLDFIQSLDGENVIEFAEDKKFSQLDWMKGFVKEILPKTINFNEIATRDKDVGGKSAGEQLTVLTHKKMADNKDLTFSKAFSQVQIEHPDLAKEYKAEING